MKICRINQNKNQNKDKIHQAYTEIGWAGRLRRPAHPIWVCEECI